MEFILSAFHAWTEKDCPYLNFDPDLADSLEPGQRGFHL